MLCDRGKTLVKSTAFGAVLPVPFLRIDHLISGLLNLSEFGETALETLNRCVIGYGDIPLRGLSRNSLLGLNQLPVLIRLNQAKTDSISKDSVAVRVVCELWLLVKCTFFENVSHAKWKAVLTEGLLFSSSHVFDFSIREE
jgi:hypothetical protein